MSLTLIFHRYIVNDIQSKAVSIQSQGNQRGGGGGAANAMQDNMALHELKDRVNNVANDIKALYNKPQVLLLRYLSVNFLIFQKR